MAFDHLIHKFFRTNLATAINPVPLKPLFLEGKCRDFPESSNLTIEIQLFLQRFTEKHCRSLCKQKMIFIGFYVV